MTGKELLARVRKYLPNACTPETLAVLGALDGCVLLTAEEAELVRGRFIPHPPGKPSGQDCPGCVALALLTPDGKEKP